MEMMLDPQAISRFFSGLETKMGPEGYLEPQEHFLDLFIFLPVREVQSEVTKSRQLGMKSPAVGIDHLPHFSASWGFLGQGEFC